MLMFLSLFIDGLWRFSTAITKALQHWYFPFLFHATRRTISCASDRGLVELYCSSEVVREGCI